MERENEYLDVDAWQKEQKAREQKEEQIRRRERRSYFFGGLAAGLFVALLIVGMTYLVSRIHKYVFTQDEQDNVETDSIEVEAGSVLSVEMMEKIKTIEKMIKKNYYQDEDIDSQAMEEGIYIGLVDSLGDPYSEYYSQEELTALLQNTEGIYYGIGAGVSQDLVTLYPEIVKVYADTPAEEAGLRENDIIYEVEGESTYDMSTTDVVAKIKGEEGTWVNLTIYREGESDYLSIDVQRRKVNIPTIEYEMLEDGMAHIIITEFSTITVEQFAQSLAQARSQGMKGLILDVRSNPGGSLDAVVEICRMLLPKGMIVYTQDKYGKKAEYTCDGTKQLEVPMVVLINGNSASASEILAGAIKDYGIGTLVGTTTYGKGIVQSVMPMKDGSAVKLTVSSYFTPNGNNIHEVGIEPDVECIFDGEAYYNQEGNPDNQLEKAKEVLADLIK